MFLRWKANWWDLQGRARTDISTSLADGLQSYATKQERIHSNLADSFANQWYPILISNDLPVGWPQPTDSNITAPETDFDSEDEQMEEISNYD
jgi:hypothetical protein